MAPAEVEAWTPDLVAAVHVVPMPGDQVNRGDRLLVVAARVWREDGGCDLHLVPLEEWQRR